MFGFLMFFLGIALLCSLICVLYFFERYKRLKEETERTRRQRLSLENRRILDAQMVSFRHQALSKESVQKTAVRYEEPPKGKVQKTAVRYEEPPKGEVQKTAVRYEEPLKGKDVQPEVLPEMEGLRFVPVPFFTKTEQKFYRVLLDVVPDGYIVFSKVSLWGVVRNLEKKGWGRISQKHVDFVILSASTLEVVLALELDDYTHAKGRKGDKVKDYVLRSAGVPFLRYGVQKVYDVPRLRNLILSHLDNF